MKQSFRDSLHMSKANVERLHIINAIIDEYAADDYVLTLRQLYYQLVSRDIIPNQQKEYAKLSDLLVKGRMAGVVDWDAIEDRVRVPHIPYSVRDKQHALQDTIDQYRLNRMEGQENYIELWVEKDALSGVLSRVTEEYHIRLMVNRGYSSCSAMHDSAMRFLRAERNDQKGTILYLGDHDPSGLDMIRDVAERMAEFGVTVDVHHIGLTSAQIQKYDPPPNPAKFSDPRAGWYVREHGKVSWEVDALPPKVLNALVKKEVEERIDMKLFNKQVALEEEDKETLQEVANNFES